MIRFLSMKIDEETEEMNQRVVGMLGEVCSLRALRRCSPKNINIPNPAYNHSINLFVRSVIGRSFS